MFLSDNDLVRLVYGPSPIIQGVRQSAQPHGKDSPIQPSSVDLSVGRIHIPDTVAGAPGSELNPKMEHSLKPGETAVIATQEQFNLPADVLGVAFPPSRVSFKGILMTNPGHIDPGYRGPLRFTLINMSSQDFIVRQGDPIVSVLLFRLAAPVGADWLRRHDGNPGGYPSQEDIDKPSADFVNVSNRAKQIATEEVAKAELKLKSWQVLVPLVTAIVTALITVAVTWIRPAWKEPVAQIQADVQTLKTTIDVASVKSRVDALERELKAARDSAARGGTH
jgi:deoxycytidine triphosphate deaminase/outer membrane murein-binding lipoprotein Lpp